MKLNKTEKATIILACLHGHLYRQIDQGNLDMIDNLKYGLEENDDNVLFEAASLHFGEIGQNYVVIGKHAQVKTTNILDQEMTMARRALQSRLGA